MSVAVISKTGERLMPTSEYRARKLLKSGKAIKYSYHPFTIQLTERKTGEYNGNKNHNSTGGCR